MKRKLLSSVIALGVFSYSAVLGMKGVSLAESSCEKMQLQSRKTVSEFVSQYGDLIDKKINVLEQYKVKDLQATQEWKDAKIQKSTSIRRYYLVRKAAMEIMSFNIVISVKKKAREVNEQLKGNVHQFDRFFNDPNEKIKINERLGGLEEKYSSNTQTMDLDSFIELFRTDANEEDLEKDGALGRCVRLLHFYITATGDSECLKVLKRCAGILISALQKKDEKDKDDFLSLINNVLLENNTGWGCMEGFRNRLYELIDIL